jgi:hypothetical protein
MPKLTEKEICYKWLVNKTINPETSRKIKEDGAVYKKLNKLCSLNEPNKKEVKKTNDDLCDKWLKNKTVNPETSRKIKEDGAIYKKLAKKCLSKSEDIDKYVFKTPIKIKSTIIKPKSSSETKKINAMKKIHKLFLPYINRSSINIIDRINYFLIIRNYILSIKEKNNCMKLYNIDEKTNKPIYRIGRNIILDRQIGSDSAYGIVFLSHFKSNVKYGTKFDKINKFAVKITDQINENKIELLVLKELTKKVIELKCPHFPINYGSLECNSTPKPKISDDYLVVKGKQGDKKLYPKFINKNRLLYIQINELATGDLYNNLISRENKDLPNSFVQILLSMMFFHKYINAHHSDTHEGNFLYHKIKPGGYFHYNLYGTDYYLENKGYLWVIWDFGSITPFQNSKQINNNKFGEVYTKLKIVYDYLNLIDRLNKFTDLLSPEFINICKLLKEEVFAPYNKQYNFEYDVNLFKKLDVEILEFLVKNVKSFRTKKPSDIINKTPYIIR